MHRAPVATACVWLCLIASGAALAQPAPRGIAACRGITDAAARLACYDALPLPPAQPAAAAPAAPAVPGAAAAAAVGPLAAAPASPLQAGAAPAPATPAASFGIERSARDELKEISSRFEGVFEGWGATTRIRLANGQVWQVADGSSAALYLQSPRITVKRALLGDFVMEFEGSNRTAKVRRVE